MRAAALIVAGLDTLAWLLIGYGALFSESDPAGRGLDQAAGVFVTILYAVTGLPALVLAVRNKAPKMALGLALAPIVIVVGGTLWLAASM